MGQVAEGRDGRRVGFGVWYGRMRIVHSDTSLTCHASKAAARIIEPVWTLAGKAGLPSGNRFRLVSMREMIPMFDFPPSFLTHLGSMESAPRLIGGVSKALGVPDGELPEETKTWLAEGLDLSRSCVKVSDLPVASQRLSQMAKKLDDGQSLHVTPPWKICAVSQRLLSGSWRLDYFFILRAPRLPFMKGGRMGGSLS